MTKCLLHPYFLFLTFFIFVITSCAFEAVITPFLQKYHWSLQHWPLVNSSVCINFPIESISKFSRNTTIVFESFIRLPMPVICQSVTISQTKSLLGFVTAPKSILFGTIFSNADAKSINDNGFLSDLANGLNFFFGLATSGLFFLPSCAKSSLSKIKPLIFVGSISFLHGSHHLQNCCFHSKHCSRNMIARLTHAHHKSAMAQPNQVVNQPDLW